MLDRSRLLIRLSGWSIVQVHRGELKKAAATLKEAQESLGQIHLLLQRNPELGNAGNVRVAEQEYTEARCLYILVRSGKLPSIKQIQVESTSYILGLLDLIGELRRLTLNHLRRGRGIEAEKSFAIMEQMYEDLLSLDHTAIVPTFRNKADNARRIIESTRGDVVTEIRRLSLERAIKRLEKRLNG
ncbi:MAG: translin family protein [archaeon]